jgi:uncharacterized C2H2 Zn-finger protein
LSAEKKTMYPCPECGKEFESLRSVGPHRRAAHGYRVPKTPGIGRNGLYGQKLPCPHCDFVAQWKGGLTKHIEAAHPEQPKPGARNHKCPECDLVFNRPSKLGAHRQLAHGVKGTSIAALKREKTKAKRSNELATQTETLPTTVNGHHEEAPRAADAHPDYITAIAFGRFTEFCSRLADEFDLSKRDLTQRLVGAILQSQIRPTSRGAHRLPSL